MSLFYDFFIDFLIFFLLSSVSSFFVFYLPFLFLQSLFQYRLTSIFLFFLFFLWACIKLVHMHIDLFYFVSMELMWKCLWNWDRHDDHTFMLPMTGFMHQLQGFAQSFRVCPCLHWFQLMGEEPDLDPDITRDFFERNILQLDASLLTENGIKSVLSLSLFFFLFFLVLFRIFAFWIFAVVNHPRVGQKSYVLSVCKSFYWKCKMHLKR